MRISKLIRNGIIIGAMSTLSLTGCSGEDGVDGKDAPEVNIDSLANVLRDEITGTLWDSLYAEPYVDTVYNILFDNAFATAWMDSVRNALLDSLRTADYDSLYRELYDSVYADIYSQAVIRTLKAWTWSSKDNIYGAFANLYPLMYKDYIGSSGQPAPMPLGVKISNTCEQLTLTEEDLMHMTQEQYDALAAQVPPCRWKKILVKAWIEGFTDTATVSGTVNPDTTKTFGPTFNFDNEALLALTAPMKTNIQVRVYALENDHEILFFSESEPVTVHPMQVNGGELANVKNPDWYSGVWVTPNMDSIPNILNEVTELLPGKTLKVYQKYSEDETMAQSSARVVKAVFDVLHKRGINYVENNGAGSNGQKVNYPIEVLRSKQAVCNEFSYLVASVLEAIGFQVYIVKIPGHMFIGWASEKDSKSLGFIETTMLASESATFADAYEAGGNKFNEEQESGNFESGKSVIIFLQNVREYGIAPNDIP